MCIVWSNGVAELVIAKWGEGAPRVTYVAFCVIVRVLAPTNGPIQDNLLI